MFVVTEQFSKMKTWIPKETMLEYSSSFLSSYLEDLFGQMIVKRVFKVEDKKKQDEICV